MSLEYWCYISAGGLMALTALRLLAVGREAALLDAARANEAKIAAATRRAAMIAALELGDSDVTLVNN